MLHRTQTVEWLNARIDDLEAQLELARNALENAYNAMASAEGFDIDQWTEAVDGAAKALAKLTPAAAPEEHGPPEDESLARLIAVKLGFLVDTFPEMVLSLTKSDCFRAADAILASGYRCERGPEPQR